MRPGPIGPGNNFVHDHVAFGRLRLQCGPAQLGREIFRLNWSQTIGEIASMRPGPIGPGNAARIRPAPRPRPGFNAARPNWAGKYLPDRPPADETLPGFNAARPNWAGK